MREHFYFTYIVASKSRTLYVGVSGDLRRRVFEHKLRKHAGFTARYNCNRLVWFERFTEVSFAIEREKELKGWTRTRKVALIETANPTWEDLSEEWFPFLGAQQASRKADPSLPTSKLKKALGAPFAQDDTSRA
ncbi:MAG TPA: GIY-YIG nuclease family protein [Terracidiphilus sp.]|jgi:putative endonuclease